MATRLTTFFDLRISLCKSKLRPPPNSLKYLYRTPADNWSDLLSSFLSLSYSIEMTGK